MNRTALWLLVSVTFLTPALHSQNIQVDKNNRTIAITKNGDIESATCSSATGPALALCMKP